MNETSDDNEDKPKEGYELRDSQTIRKPKRFDDYVMVAEKYVNEEIPDTHDDAIKSEQSAEWQKAMKSELQSLHENKTWEMVSLPKGEKTIPCKWVFRLKTKPDGQIDKYKARLVVKGFSQRQGIDFSQTFSPVAKLRGVGTYR